QNASSQVQRGASRPLGNVRMRMPRHGHSRYPKPVSSMLKISGLGATPFKHSEMPNTPKSSSVNETNTPSHSRDLRQKISAATVIKTSENTISTAIK